MLDPKALANPVYDANYNVRDPSILPCDDGYRVFFTRYDGPWRDANSWAIGTVFTRDFLRFEGDRDVSPKGYASPGDPVFWHGRYVMPYQVYPGGARLCFSESRDGADWSAPRVFLEEVLKLPWNHFERAIDPILVVDGGELHCFFVGSRAREKNPGHANLLGHAVSRDADLAGWDILTREKPLMGLETLEAGGVENVAVFPAGGQWIMAYSEFLTNQRLALATSADLIRWMVLGPIPIPVPRQRWLARTEGAPCVWSEGGRFWMLFMGTDEHEHTSLGLMCSRDGLNWRVLEEEGS